MRKDPDICRMAEGNDALCLFTPHALPPSPPNQACKDVVPVTPGSHLGTLRREAVEKGLKSQLLPLAFQLRALINLSLCLLFT